MKFSYKMILSVIIYIIISQYIVNFLWNDYWVNQTMILILTTNIAALTMVIVAYYKAEIDIEKAKSKFMNELGLKEEDVAIYSDKFLPLLRKLKDVDIDKMVKLIDYGIKKFKKIDVDELTEGDWGLDEPLEPLTKSEIELFMDLDDDEKTGEIKDVRSRDKI